LAATVLDSFALLAYLRGEPGSERVRDLLDKASQKNIPLHMTEINYAEVKYITLRKQGDEAWRDIVAGLPALPIEFHAVDRALSDIAADFKARGGLSLADAFAAALAKDRKAELVTGDPEFKTLEREIKILWLRNQ
jgi:ribonuclease VapC